MSRPIVVGPDPGERAGVLMQGSVRVRMIQRADVDNGEPRLWVSTGLPWDGGANTGSARLTEEQWDELVKRVDAELHPAGVPAGAEGQRTAQGNSPAGRGAGDP